MGDIAVRVSGLGKQYRIGARRRRSDSLRETLIESVSGVARLWRGQRTPPESETIWALKDVSFEVKRGEVLGIIGRNGAGKSTLLKILARITEPTCGEVDVYGRVGSLLEVGTGFHPELTGRENVYLNGAVLGMRRREIQGKFDEIVDFAGIDKFIDTPVKHYSSGMYMRLAFAVAAHLEPEILIVDEVLAVGDAEFQKKCLGKMGEVASEGRTVLFVSHNMASLDNLCTRGLLLDHGRLIFSDPIKNVIEQYSGQVLRQTTTAPLAERQDRSGNGEVVVIDFYMEDANGQRVDRIQSGQECRFCFAYRCKAEVAPSCISIGFAVFDNWRYPLFRNSTDVTNSNFERIPSHGVFKCIVPALPLIGGDYLVSLVVTASQARADYVDDAGRFTVEDGDFYGTGRLDHHSPVLVRNSWIVV